MDILSEFPQLFSKDKDGLLYDGYITICNQRFRLEVQLPQSKDLSDATVNCDWRLQQILSSHKNIIRQRLSQCDSLLSFLKELQSIVERQLDGVESLQASTSKFCGHLITHIAALGWDKNYFPKRIRVSNSLDPDETSCNVASYQDPNCLQILSQFHPYLHYRLVYIDQAFSQLHLQYEDAGNRSHLIKVQVGNKYPEEAPVCSVELPEKFDVHWMPQSEIKHVYEQFTAAIKLYQEFWNMMTNLDKNTWVLEPEKPNFSARHRRIAITPSVSVQITVDPTHPRVLPECKFLGSDQAIAPVRQSMNSNLHLWDERGDLLSNLQTVLGVQFPSPNNSEKESFSGECGICYAYRMESEIPDEVCNDSRCSQAYHKTCLIEWLRSLPSSRQSFNTIFGSCPYCEKQITVKMVAK